MLKVENVVKAIEAFAPLDIQAEYDNSGLLFGDPQWEIKGILVTLDNSEEAVKEAIEKGCNMIVEHHPSIFLPVKKINLSVPKQRALALAIKNDIAIYSAHTTVDFTVGGLNDVGTRKHRKRRQFTVRRKNRQTEKSYGVRCVC